MLETSNIFWSTQFKTPPSPTSHFVLRSEASLEEGKGGCQRGPLCKKNTARADCSEKSKLLEPILK